MGLFEHMHIKGHTAGSSNELSFDVLQKASGGGDPSTTKPIGISSRKGKGGAISLSKIDAAREAAASAYTKGKSGKNRNGSPYTSTTNGQSYVLSGSAEVAKRKKARRGFRLLTWVAAGLVVILLLCAGIFLNDRINQDRMNFKTRLTNLTTQLATIDKDLAIIDQLTVDPLIICDFEQMKTWLGDIPGITSSVVGVEDQAQEIRNIQPAGYDAQALSDLEESAKAREELLASAARLFEVSVQAGYYIEQANDVWELVVEASKTAADTAWQSNQATTEEAIAEDSAAMQAAIEDLSQALRQLEFMKTNLSDMDLSPYIDYATAKRRALQYAIETNEALLALDRDKAQIANDKYNAAEKKASDLGNAITQSISDKVREAYQSRIESAESSYENAREVVIAADYALRQRIS